ncbi:hypothetical protein QJQ45_008080 [Haematococcus lacustris]|nr:hypothetical protein QJQ45_008080 [Haematococcus lacustris]
MLAAPKTTTSCLARLAHSRTSKGQACKGASLLRAPPKGTNGVNDVELSLELAGTALNIATGYFFDTYGPAYTQRMGYRHQGEREQRHDRGRGRGPGRADNIMFHSCLHMPEWGDRVGNGCDGLLCRMQLRGYLRPGGALVMKVYDGSGTTEFMRDMQPYFSKVVRMRVDATRSMSREFYAVGLGRKKP